ncbi:hypothetical protein [Azospirillum sp. TSH58]|uniref:hypothetical protein n=1 Tax=Azospirillum sp. TSH58 TaxID=664962 RepID=UPI0013A563DD|nr:hypothetical protein [Azospirillum sp. TSH58]
MEGIEGRPHSKEAPSYRHVFNALCLIGHSRGYKLPRYDAFKKLYFSCLINNEFYDDKRDQFFIEGDASKGFTPNFLRRLSGWYRDGIAHTHLYCAFVQAYEEQRRVGGVFLDSRADLKLKADILVVTPNKVACIDLQYAEGDRQAELLGRRAKSENRSKENNNTSSHKGNPITEDARRFFVSKNNYRRMPNGLYIYSEEVINKVIEELDKFFEIPAEIAITYEEMRNIKMWELQKLKGNIPRFPPKIPDAD